MPGLIEGVMASKGAKEQQEASDDEFTRLEGERKRALAMGDALKWTPEMVSKSLGSYQRSKSPVADAFLGSFLSGNNDQAIQSTRAGAPRMKAEAKASFDQQYGGWDKLRQQDAEMRESQPWKLKDIAGVEKFDESKVPSDVPYLDKDQVSALGEQGLKYKGADLDKDALKQIKFWTGLDDLTTRGSKGQEFMQALSAYMQQGGSWKDLTFDASNKTGKMQKVNVDEFLAKYRPQGSVSLAKPAPAPPARA